MKKHFDHQRNLYFWDPLSLVAYRNPLVGFSASATGLMCMRLDAVEGKLAAIGI